MSEVKEKHPFSGRYVLCRGYYNGIHTGVLVNYDADNDVAFLKESRRLYRWKSKFSLSEIAMSGIFGEKIAVEVPDIMIREVFEIIPCTQEAEKRIREYPAYVVSEDD